MKIATRITLAAMLLALVGCAAGGFNSVQKTAQLRPGMSFDEVVALLDPPKEAAFVDGKRVATARGKDALAQTAARLAQVR